MWALSGQGSTSICPQANQVIPLRVSPYQRRDRRTQISTLWVNPALEATEIIARGIVTAGRRRCRMQTNSSRTIRRAPADRGWHQYPLSGHVRLGSDRSLR